MIRTEFVYFLQYEGAESAELAKLAGWMRKAIKKLSYYQTCDLAEVSTDGSWPKLMELVAALEVDKISLSYHDAVNIRTLLNFLLKSEGLTFSCPQAAMAQQLLLDISNVEFSDRKVDRNVS